MKCDFCGSKKVKKETITHKFAESGLDNVILVGVERKHCKECGESTLNFGPLNAIHDCIVKILLHKDELLTGPEIRFLRASIGLSGKDFAEKIGYNTQVWSKIENGHNTIEKKLDRLVRLSVQNTKPSFDYHLFDKASGKKIKSKKDIRINVKTIWQESGIQVHC